MVMIQYRVIEIKTGKLFGYLVGKTPDRELVVDRGSKTVLLKINARTESKYRVEAVEVSSTTK